MSAPKKSRRGFLADTLGQGRARIGESSATSSSATGLEATIPEQPAEFTCLLQIDRRAMACQFAILLNDGQYTQGPESALQALDLVETLEDQMSVYLASSEISQLNHMAARQPVVVEPRLFELLEVAMEIYSASDGAFDITSAPLSKLWGFSRRQGQVPSEGDIEAVLENVGSHLLELDQKNRTISFSQSATEINLGGIGKGFALDRCQELLRAEGVEHVLMHGGKSSVIAQGDRGTAEQLHGWKVGVRHPLRADARLLEIQLHDQALSTSGAATQSFHHQGKRYGHILDPRNGYPSAGVYSATVVADSAAVADALSTAFYVLGHEKSMEYCSLQENMATAIVVPGDHSGRIDIHTYGFCEEDIKIVQNQSCQFIRHD